jgi:ribosomal protein L40E
LTYCHKCGKKNKDNADFCFSCGTKISVDDKDSFEKRIDEWGEEIGRSAERFGKKVEDVAKRVHEKVIESISDNAKNSNKNEGLKDEELEKDVKYCIKCGAKYYGEANYCYKCGNKI